MSGTVASPAGAGRIYACMAGVSLLSWISYARMVLPSQARLMSSDWSCGGGVGMFLFSSLRHPGAACASGTYGRDDMSYVLILMHPVRPDPSGMDCPGGMRASVVGTLPVLKCVHYLPALIQSVVNVVDGAVWMRNCEDVDLSDRDVRPLGPGVTGRQDSDADEESDPPADTHQCFGRFRWLHGHEKNVKCERCAYFGRCYIETVFKGGRKI